MMRTRVLHAVAVACSMLVASAAAQDAIFDDRVADIVEEAQTLIEQGLPAQAKLILDAALRETPDNPWFLLFLGAAERDLNIPRTAKSRFEQAARILEQRNDPEEQDLADEIMRQLSTIERELINVSVTFGLAYDTNVSYRGGALNAFDTVSGEDDGKYAAHFQFESIVFDDENQRFSIGGRVGYAWHFSVKEFDFQNYGAYLHYTYRLADHWTMDLHYDYDMSTLGNDNFLSSHTLRPSLNYFWPVNDSVLTPTTSSVYYEFVARDFLSDTTKAEDRDGFVNAIGFGQGFRLAVLPDWYWILNTGYTFSAINTEGTEFERLTHDFFLGVDVPLLNPLLDNLPLNFKFATQWQVANYGNKSVIDRKGRHRDDFLVNYTWLLTQTLREDPEQGDVFLHGIITWTDADSDLRTEDRSNPFTYDKVVYGLQLQWSW